MGLARKLIGNRPECLIPPESRLEKDQPQYKKPVKGKIIHKVLNLLPINQRTSVMEKAGI